MTLTEKFYRDCTCYYPEGNSEEWKEFQERNSVFMNIDNRSSNKDEHTIEFVCRLKTSGNRRKYFTATFSRIGGEFIKVNQELGGGKTLKTEDVEQLLREYTNFINEMAFYGYLLV